MPDHFGQLFRGNFIILDIAEDSVFDRLVQSLAFIRSRKVDDKESTWLDTRFCPRDRLHSVGLSGAYFVVHNAKAASRVMAHANIVVSQTFERVGRNHVSDLEWRAIGVRVNNLDEAFLLSRQPAGIGMLIRGTDHSPTKFIPRECLPLLCREPPAQSSFVSHLMAGTLVV